MKTIFGRKAALGVAVAMLAVAPGLALGGEPPLKGVIVAHHGATIVVRAGGSDTPVALTPTTKIRGGGQDRPSSDLIRGLTVSVATAHEGNGLTATQVTFKNSDFKVAQQISAGIAMTEHHVAQNSERIENVGDFTAVDRTSVYFAVGKSAISPKGKQDLQAIATKAKAIKGFRLAVVGRADTTGSAANNQRLSEARAAAVVDYLLKNCGILPGRILPAAAAGSSSIVDDPHPPKDAADARRVTVTIAVSKSARPTG